MTDDEKQEVFTQTRIMVAVLKSEMQLQFQHIDKALKLQTEQYKEKLEELKEMQSLYLPYEKISKKKSLLVDRLF